MGAADSKSSDVNVATTEQAFAALGLPPEALPRHIAVIMDGNGRWAKQHDQPRAFGHRQGAKAVRPIVTECARLGIEVLTLYSFSVENWKRPTDEIETLMELYAEYLEQERPTMLENNIQFAQIGRREGLPPHVLDQIDRTIEQTATNTGLTLVLAINYGSRAEIVDAVRGIARRVEAGEIGPDDIDEQTIDGSLYTHRWPDPDLLIRTAGEMRVSNYLLWQISYAELYVGEVCWPDFDLEQLRHALREYARRTRRFGAVV